MSMIKLSRIVFEGVVQIGNYNVREYQLAENEASGARSAQGVPSVAGCEAHLHPELQCISMRSMDVTTYVPLRLVRSMEIADKHAHQAEADKGSQPHVVVSTDEGSQQSPYSQLDEQQRSALHALDHLGVARRKPGRPRTKTLGVE